MEKLVGKSLEIGLLIHYQAIPHPTNVKQIAWMFWVGFKDLAQSVDMPFGKLTRFVRVGAVALGFGDEGLVRKGFWGVARQNDQVVERCRRK